MAATKRKTPKLGPMDAGFLTPLITDFGASLAALGRSRLTIGGYTDSARHFTAWMLDGCLALDEVGKDTIDRFARHHCQCAGARRWSRVSTKYVRRAGRFVEFLADRKVISLLPGAVAEIVHPRILDYQRWLFVHRGLSDRSVSQSIASSPTVATSTLHSAGRTFGAGSMSSPSLVRHRSPAKRSNVLPGSTPSRKTSGDEVPRSAKRSDP